MYRTATEGDQLRFGDIVEADWIFDLCLRADAKALSAQTLPAKRGGGKVLVAEERSAMTNQRPYPRDLVMAHSDYEGLALGHGDVLRTATRAVVMSDDCDLAEAEEKMRGRLKLAGLVPLPADPNVRTEWLTAEPFDRFALPPQHELEPPFEGGMIEFQRTFGAMAKDLLTLKPVLTFADEQQRQNLRIRWNAHVTRHGPAVAAQAALDLIKLRIADGDEERAKALRKEHDLQLDPEDAAMIEQMKRVAALNWVLEGGTVDAIADALTRGDQPEAIFEHVAALLDRLGEGAQEAAGAVRAALQRRD